MPLYPLISIRSFSRKNFCRHLEADRDKENEAHLPPVMLVTESSVQRAMTVTTIQALITVTTTTATMFHVVDHFSYVMMIPRMMIIHVVVNKPVGQIS